MLEYYMILAIGFVSLSMFVAFDARKLSSNVPQEVKYLKYIDNHAPRALLRAGVIALIPLHLLFTQGLVPYVSMVLAVSFLYASSFSPMLSMALGYDFYHLGDTADWDKWWKRRMKLYIFMIWFLYHLALAIPIALHYLAQ